MITLTIAEALTRKANSTKDHYLYLYRDGDITFYVGRSTRPIRRMAEHMKSMHMDDLGMLINRNMPASMSWVIEMYTLEECLRFVQQHNTPSLELYKKILQGEQQYQYKMLANVAEESMILHYKPCLNVVGKQSHSQLPEKYVKPNNDVANKGIILGY